MKFVKVDVNELMMNPFDMIGNQWYLLTAGNLEDYNTMTCSWGHMGVVWGAPSMQCMVRTNRHTLSYMDKNEYFTISFFDEEQYRSALNFCGSHSGRDCDKAKETGLTPVEIEGCTAFEQAELVLVCKKKYSAMMQPEGFVNQETYDKWYGKDPMHREFIGEIVGCYLPSDE